MPFGKRNVPSKLRDPITQRVPIISQKKGILGYAAAKPIKTLNF
jgi:hypothetical protein